MPDNSLAAVDELRRKARRRLVGAVVLALAAAVVLPMFLESDPKPLGDDVKIQIPPLDQQKFEPKLGPGGGMESGAASRPQGATSSPGQGAATSPAPATPSTGATPVPKTDTAPARSADKPPAPAEKPADKLVEKPAAAKPDKPAADKPVAEKPAEKPASKPPEATAGKPDKSEKPAPAADRPDKEKPDALARLAAAADAKQTTGSFVVQLGVFSIADTAAEVVAKAKASGFNAYSEKVATSKGDMARVRVGPFASREAAEAARDKLKARGQSGFVVAR